MSLENGQRRTSTATRMTSPVAVPRDLGSCAGEREEVKIAGIDENHVGKAMAVSIRVGFPRTLTATRMTGPEAVPRDLGSRAGKREVVKRAGIEEKHVGKTMTAST